MKIKIFGLKALSEHGERNMNLQLNTEKMLEEKARTCLLIDECEIHALEDNESLGARGMTYELEKFEETCIRNYKDCKIYRGKVRENANAVEREINMFNSSFLGVA